MAANSNKKKVRTRRRERKNIEKGQVHISSSFNNTMVTVTDTAGNAISWASAGGRRSDSGRDRSTRCDGARPEDC